MNELNSSAFDSLNNAFDTSFDQEEILINAINSEKNELQVIEDEMKEIEEKKDSIKNDLNIQDVNYLKKEIKTLIISSKDVLNRLNMDIKIGSNARMYEVYSSLLNSITAQLKELRNLNESIVRISMEQNKKNINNVSQNEKIELTANQLLDMVKAASENSEIKKVDATFEIDNENIEDGNN